MESRIYSSGHEEVECVQGWIGISDEKDYEMLWGRDEEFEVGKMVGFLLVEHFRGVSYFRLVEGQEEDRFDA